MDFLIQQDGRIQMNHEIRPGRSHYRTFETPPAQCHEYRSYRHEIIPIERTFRKLGTEGNITVWVEV